jgi:hypothetical protein
MDGQHDWQSRSPNRMPDPLWQATLLRVRGEFEEMPCIRVTLDQACTLLGLEQPVSAWVLERLAQEGFLAKTPQGEYMRDSGGH